MPREKKRDQNIRNEMMIRGKILQEASLWGLMLQQNLNHKFLKAYSLEHRILAFDLLVVFLPISWEYNIHIFVTIRSKHSHKVLQLLS